MYFNWRPLPAHVYFRLVLLQVEGVLLLALVVLSCWCRWYRSLNLLLKSRSVSKSEASNPPGVLSVLLYGRVGGEAFWGSFSARQRSRSLVLR